MPADMKPVLRRLAAGEILSEADAEAAFATVMDGDATAAQIAGMLTALHMRGETVPELRGALRAMRARMAAIEAPPGVIDVCGTGGDGLATLNVSTATAFVVAGCGVPVAKHGNRAVSSRAGGADVLAAMGIGVQTAIACLPGILERCGLVFLFAPTHHPALRHAAVARAELGFRTIFNLLGPMANPAGVRRQLIGVYDPRWAGPMAETLAGLGAEFAWVVHGQGLDELTLAGETQVTEWNGAGLRHFAVAPEDAGLARAPIEAIRGGDPAHNAAALAALLLGDRGAYRDTVLLNAAAALMVAGRVTTLRQGALCAAESLDSRAAHAVWAKLRAETTAPPAED